MMGGSFGKNVPIRLFLQAYSRNVIFGGVRGKQGKFIWSSYYKRIASLAGRLGCPKRIWSSYYKRIVDVMVVGNSEEWRKITLEQLL